MKTSELTRAALDLAVAKCCGFEGIDEDQWLLRGGIADMPLSAYNPSTDWAQGGPIIEREGIAIRPFKDGGEWLAKLRIHQHDGPTPLVAAMRCFVASRLGDEVDIPDELQG